MNAIKILSITVLVALFAGCSNGEPSIDATSEQTVLASIKEMVAAHPDYATRRELQLAVNAVGRNALLNADRSGMSFKDLEDLAQQDWQIIRDALHGMTAQRLLAEMKRIQSE